jgi:hypothetical protein
MKADRWRSEAHLNFCVCPHAYAWRLRWTIAEDSFRSLVEERRLPTAAQDAILPHKHAITNEISG